MKKSDIFLILGLILVVILGFFVMKGDVYKPGYELPMVLKGEPGLHELTYEEFQEKVDNDEEFVLIIERASCSYCVQFMPVAEEAAEEKGVPLYYVDTDTFSKDEMSLFVDSIDYFEDNQQWGTPTTLVLAGKETVHFVEGTLSEDNLKSIYDEYFELGE